jgi:hypothetical protein
VRRYALTVDEFMARWRRADSRERSAAQERLIDLCPPVGHPAPAEADSTGATFCFEKGVGKTGSAGVPPAAREESVRYVRGPVASAIRQAIAIAACGWPGRQAQGGLADMADDQVVEKSPALNAARFAASTRSNVRAGE